MKSYKDLGIFQQSKALAIPCTLCRWDFQNLKCTRREVRLDDHQKQLPAAIVEGYGRRKYKNDFITYLIYSQAECDETLVHLNFLLETGSANNSNMISELLYEYDVLSKRINKLTQWIEQNLENKRT